MFMHPNNPWHGEEKKHDKKKDNKPSYIPDVEAGLFAGIGIGTSTTVLLPSFGELSGTFQGLVVDEYAVYALLLSGGALRRINVRDVISVRNP